MWRGEECSARTGLAKPWPSGQIQCSPKSLPCTMSSANYSTVLLLLSLPDLGRGMFWAVAPMVTSWCKPCATGVTVLSAQIRHRLQRQSNGTVTRCSGQGFCCCCRTAVTSTELVPCRVGKAEASTSSGKGGGKHMACLRSVISPGSNSRLRLNQGLQQYSSTPHGTHSLTGTSIT